MGEPEILRNLSNECMATEPERKHEHNVVKILPQGQAWHSRRYKAEHVKTRGTKSPDSFFH